MMKFGGPVCGLVGGSCEWGGTEGGWVGHEGGGSGKVCFDQIWWLKIQHH